MKTERPCNGASPSTGERSEDAAVVRTAYRALGEEDISTFTRCVDPQVEWIHPMVARLPFDGVRRGLPAVLHNAFRRDIDGARPRVSAETFLEFGDGVLVVGRFLVRNGAQGEEIEEPFVHECFVRDGRVISIREYPA